MCSAPNVYMFVYTLIGAHIVPLNITKDLTPERAYSETHVCSY